MQYQEYTNRTTADNLWNGIFGDFEDQRKYLIFYNLTEILLPFRNKQINNFTLGLKIPIVPENKFFYLNISFWIDVCFKLTGNANIKPFLFWSKKSTETERYLILFLNQPSHNNYAHFINPSHIIDSICLTDSEGNIENCMQSLNDKYKSILEQKDLSLSELLQNI